MKSFIYKENSKFLINKHGNLNVSLMKNSQVNGMKNISNFIQHGMQNKLFHFQRSLLASRKAEINDLVEFMKMEA